MLMYRGPMPYTELDAERFFGRDGDVDSIAEVVQRNRLSILIAPSGVGKTSVLLGGVVPRLRYDHAREIIADEIQLGLTLICRSWSGAHMNSADAVLLAALAAATHDLKQPDRTAFLRSNPDADDAGSRERLEAEAARLSDVLQHAESEDAFVVLCRYADAVDRLVLIFDQFENVLRSTDQKRVLGIIANIFHHEPRIRILLSFRQEFMMHLHELEASIGGLAKRTYYLQAMNTEAVSEAILKPALQNQVTMTVEAVETIKNWLIGDGAPASETTKIFEPSLLSLQALLADIQDFVDQRKTTSIDSSLLTDYAKWRNVQTRQLASYSMEVHVEKVLSCAFETSSYDRFARGATPKNKLDLLRRLFARLAPMLTSGSRPGTPGYKNSVRLVSIVQEVLRGDLEILGIKLSGEEAIVLSTQFDLQHLSLDFHVKGAATNTSGMARRLAWSSERTVHVLVAALGEALRRLCLGNIVRMTGTGPEALYELVHDGLGPAMLSWADAFRDTSEDAMASLTRISGATFRWRAGAFAEGSSVEDMSWSGCVIERQQFNSVTFMRCDLRGTMFVGCTFAGCAFIECTMDSVVLMECKFLPARSLGNAQTHISRCSLLSALIRNCTFYDGLFEATRLDGTVFEGNDVFGRVDIRRCSLEIVAFRDCVLSEPRSTPAQEGVFVNECDVIFTRILAGSHGASTPFFLDAPNEIFPPDHTLLTSNPQRRYS